jgi:predicted methyltransferase
MLRHLMIASSLALVAGLSSLTAHAAEVPSNVSAAVSDPARPAEDKARDADRKPAESVAFAGVKEGDQVVDFLPGTGYFTRIFSKAVGPKGHVLALLPAGVPEKFTLGAKAIAADKTNYPNVTEAEEMVSQLPAGSVDLFWTAQNYHDLKNQPGADTAAFDKAVFTALKPGGVFLVIDHSAPTGSGVSDTNTLHRIEQKVVEDEVTSAGFKLEGTSDLLKNPNDPKTAKVFDPSIRGKTDQFVLKFRKPG